MSTRWLDWLAISYYIMIVKVFSYLPLASTTVGRIDFWQIGVYYMLLALLLYSIDHRQSIINGLSMLISRAKVFLGAACSRLVKLPLHWILLTLLILNSLAWIAVVNLPDGKLHVTFLDIGQGDSVLIQTTDGRNILIDAGPSPNSLKLQLGKALPFWDKNIAMLILTQPQSDHVNGLSGIIGNYNIGQCLHSSEASDSQAYSMLLQTIEDYNIPHDVISYPQEIWLDTVTRLEVLHPQRDSTPCNYANPECDNLVLRISYKQISFLLTADIRGPTESEIIRQRRSLQSTVLKVAHHGSNSSSTGEFIDVVNPQLAIISAGKNNAYGHPHAKTLEIIGSRIGKENIFLTSQSGNVELISDGKRLWVKTEKIEAPDT